MDQKLGSADPGYYSIAVGIVTLYCRPFTNNAKIGSLSTKKIPSKFKELHSYLWELRNKAFSHSEAGAQLPGHGKMTEVRFGFDGQYLNSFSSRPIFEPVLLPPMYANSLILCYSSSRFGYLGLAMGREPGGNAQAAISRFHPDPPERTKP